MNAALVTVTIGGHASETSRAGLVATEHIAALNVLDPTSLLAWAGAAAVIAVLFAETGLLVGFFLPGDSLLFTAGLFCSTAAGTAVHLRLGWILLAAPIGAIVGAQVGYEIGRLTGPALLQRHDRPRLTAAAARASELLAGLPKITGT